MTDEAATRRIEVLLTAIQKDVIKCDRGLNGWVDENGAQHPGLTHRSDKTDDRLTRLEAKFKSLATGCVAVSLVLLAAWAPRLVEAAAAIGRLK
jgi:hypothetical protein